eukprot:GHVT01071960.1.p1 GENE.GHVT01071960.1~~GHVT01071960.1.p1  ORF type:complete len:124 (+),score=22.97 GHVT01071960.1:238-609(+)
MLIVLPLPVCLGARYRLESEKLALISSSASRLSFMELLLAEEKQTRLLNEREVADAHEQKQNAIEKLGKERGSVAELKNKLEEEISKSSKLEAEKNALEVKTLHAKVPNKAIIRFFLILALKL